MKLFILKQKNLTPISIIFYYLFYLYLNKTFFNVEKKPFKVVSRAFQKKKSSLLRFLTLRNTSFFIASSNMCWYQPKHFFSFKKYNTRFICIMPINKCKAQLNLLMSTEETKFINVTVLFCFCFWNLMSLFCWLKWFFQICTDFSNNFSLELP